MSKTFRDDAEAAPPDARKIYPATLAVVVSIDVTKCLTTASEIAFVGRPTGIKIPNDRNKLLSFFVG